MDTRDRPMIVRLLIAAVLLVAGCSTSRPAVDEDAADGVWADYNNAIYASAVFDPANVDSMLFTAPFEQPGDSVEVLTWTTIATAERFYPLGMLPPLAVDVWVTLSPQLQRMCRAFPTDQAGLRLRLQQVLGLPPKVEQRTFVVMRAAKKDLFRPCTDPDPTQDRCGLWFPDDASMEYKAWIAEQMLSRYQAAPDGYPWTRLGYTYDWNPASSKYGASEYVLRKGSRARVLRKPPTSAYCHLGQ